MDKIPVRAKVLFGLGTTAETICLYSFSFFVMLYYNQVLGLPATLAGLGPTLALIVDAITDPIVGSWSDRLRNSKWGRRHPFMLAAPIPITLCFYLVFTPPEGLTTSELFVWLITFSVLMHVFMTLFFVPHLAFGGEMSKDYHERSSIMSYNNFGGYIGGAGAHFFGLTFFFYATAEYANGLLNPEAYRNFGASASVIVVVALYASAWFTRDRIPTLSQPKESLQSFSFSGFYSDLMQALRNPNYLYLLLGLLLLSLTLGMRAAFNNYMNLYYWEFLPDQIRWFILGSISGYLCGFLLTFYIHKRFDKRNTIVAATIGLALFDAMPVCLRMLGLFPDNGSDSLFPSILCFHALGSASGSILNISVMSALADIADENAARYGQRQEGILYAARAFFSKADRALGTLIAGIALDMISFPARAVPGQVDANVVWWLGVMDSPMTILPALLAAVLYSGYRIDKRKHTQLATSLDNDPP